MFLGRIDLIINLFTFSKNSANFNVYFFKIILLFFFLIKLVARKIYRSNSNERIYIYGEKKKLQIS